MLVLLVTTVDVVLPSCGEPPPAGHHFRPGAAAPGKDLQFMLKSVDVHGGIRDLLMLSHALYQ
jgi:hypothetical protein